VGSAARTVLDEETPNENRGVFGDDPAVPVHGVGQQAVGA
jgi:hypothetical protein